MLTAHSGSDGYIDNSLNFVNAALNSEIDCFELDCQISDSGILYLSHDKIAVIDGLLTLKEVFEIITNHENKKILLNVDCKNSKLGVNVLKMANDFKILDRVVLSGRLLINDYSDSEKKHLFYNLENIIPWKQMNNEIKLKEALAIIKKSGIKIVQTHFSSVNQDLLSMVEEYNLKLSVWTVNEIENISQFFEMGCINVTSKIAFHYLKKIEERELYDNRIISTRI